MGVSKQLRTRGAMVNGFEGASVTSDANAIVIEAQNLSDLAVVKFTELKHLTALKLMTLF